jgi:aspartate kinase
MKLDINFDLAVAVSIHKFGGSSIDSQASFLRVADIIKNNTIAGDWVIVSSSGKTTNELINIAEASIQQPELALSKLKQLEEYQINLIQVVAKSEAVRLQFELARNVSVLETYIKMAKTDFFPLPYWECFGELWSSRLLTVLLNSQEKSAIAVDAREILCLENGQFNLDKSSDLLVKSNLIQQDAIKVVTGYIARDVDNKTQTLGRNGSDYSASLFAQLTQAKQLVIWTDVNGVYSADPKVVQNATHFVHLNWDVANILAQSGNPVLHNKTLMPLTNIDCDIVIRNSHFPDLLGTKIIKNDIFYTPFVSRCRQYGVISNDWIDEVNNNHIVFEFTSVKGSHIIIKDEYTSLYSSEKFDYKTIDLVLVFGCDEQFCDFIESQSLDILHIHHFHADYRFFITERVITDELYSLFHDFMCLQFNKESKIDIALSY